MITILLCLYLIGFATVSLVMSRWTDTWTLRTIVVAFIVALTWPAVIVAIWITVPKK